MTMTLREKLRAAIAAIYEDGAAIPWARYVALDRAADAVMDLIAPLISGAGARLDALSPRIHKAPGGAEFLRCEGCGASAPYAGEIPVPRGRIAHEPDCEYIKIRTALGIQG